MKKPNFREWVKRQKSEARKLGRAGDHLGSIDVLAPVLKEFGKRFDRTALANYHLTNSIEGVSGRRSRSMDQLTERDVEQAISAYSLAGEAYVELGDSRMAEKMYRKAGNNEEAERIGGDLKDRIVGIAEDHGMGDVVAGSFALVLIFGGLLLFGVNITGNIVKNNYLSSFGLGFIFLIFILLGIFLVVKKIKRN